MPITPFPGPVPELRQSTCSGAVGAPRERPKDDDRACETPHRRLVHMPACDDPRAAVRAMAGGTRALRQAAVPVANGSEEQPRSATSSALQRPAEGAAVTAAKPRSVFRPRPGVDGVSFTVHPWGHSSRRIGNEWRDPSVGRRGGGSHGLESPRRGPVVTVGPWVVHRASRMD